jgi:hypothetical protein
VFENGAQSRTQGPETQEVRHEELQGLQWKGGYQRDLRVAAAVSPDDGRDKCSHTFCKTEIVKT